MPSLPKVKRSVSYTHLLQIQVELLQTVSHSAQNVDRSHLESFYTSFDQIKNKFYDGLVITGAPVENMDFEAVDYWAELCQIMDWSKTHVHSTLPVSYTHLLIVLTAARKGSVPPHLVSIVYSVDYQGI